MKKILTVLLCLGLISCVVSKVSKAENGEWTNKDWSASFRGGKVFYITHGSAVYGDEFGFFKAPGACSSDTIWVTFSSAKDEVLNFIGKDVVFRFIVDGRSFKITLNMLTAEKFTEVTKVMMFTNSYAGDDLISILNKGKKLTLKIIEPKELVKYLDIEDDEYSLNGFIATRLKARAMCGAVILK